VEPVGGIPDLPTEGSCDRTQVPFPNSGWLVGEDEAAGAADARLRHTR
jgi:hypothetical protein